jgi:hypothetical protein
MWQYGRQMQSTQHIVAGAVVRRATAQTCLLATSGPACRAKSTAAELARSAEKLSTAT